MPDPRDVFEHPKKYWAFLLAPDDTQFEGQYFDRKEAGRVGKNGSVSRTELKNLIGQITECISAFANVNKSGSLLVIGISSKGEVKGLNHLTDDQKNELTGFNLWLSDQAAQAKFFECVNDCQQQDSICLVYVPYTYKRICQTPGNRPRSWKRSGTRNVALFGLELEQLRRDKRVVEYELADCCTYDSWDLEKSVLQEFRKIYLSSSNYTDTSDERILYDIGAINKVERGYFFTNVGLLFFASNPQRILSASYIRLLRFETTFENAKNRGLPTFDRKFTGSLTKQIRDLRTFFKESGFFKLYQKRKPDGGFIEEPEYPLIAIDEAIVNAVAHREYAISLPIECESYQNAFVVRNSGKLQQRDRDVPKQFSLETLYLNSSPRNSKLIEWLKMMRDEHGAEFVRALSEGTRRMRDEMKRLDLPAPQYQVTESQTTVILFNNVKQREATLKSSVAPSSTEFSNLFPLNFTSQDSTETDWNKISESYKNIVTNLKSSLSNHDWYIDKSGFSKLIAHKKGMNIPISADIDDIIRFYPAYIFQVRQYLEKYYLCIDYTLEVKNIKTVKQLLYFFPKEDLIGKSSTVAWNSWELGKIISIDHEWVTVYLYDFKQEVKVTQNKIIPNLSRAQLTTLLHQSRIQFDLSRAIKKYSLSVESNSSRIRAEKTLSTAIAISQEIFPLKVNDFFCSLSTDPMALYTHSNCNGLQVCNIPEPQVEFNRHHESRDIRDGITKFGAYDHSQKKIELIPICESRLRNQMTSLIARLKLGKYKYRGSERTFGTRFIYNSVITVDSVENILSECKRILDEHPQWVGDENLDRVFLVHTPEKNYSLDDEKSPYYSVKKFLLQKGIPCQMINTSTLLDANWKDLNLALNLVAKCGVTPWVLPGAIPDADFFIGLAYTQSNRKNQGIERLMGYANVFDQYGKWQFYSGNTNTFSYDEKIEYFSLLVEETFSQLSLSETPRICFHYSKKFSKDEKNAILKAARRIRPQGVYSFIWINSHHKVRFYDGRPETDGSLSRGSYVLASPNQIYLSTTGYNPYQKALGTPTMLEINVRIEYPQGVPNSRPDMRAIAAQILSLTKLNWASTASLCGEPITTKYARDIAYLTSAFLRQDNKFKLHPALERTPWFI